MRPSEKSEKKIKNLYWENMSTVLACGDETPDTTQNTTHLSKSLSLLDGILYLNPTLQTRYFG